MIRLLALLALTLPAHAQTPCTALPDALAALSTRYGEQPRVQGLMSNGALMVITAGEAGGWSVLIVAPDGAACMAASGEAFVVIEPEPPGGGRIATGAEVRTAPLSAVPPVHAGGVFIWRG